MPQVVRMGQAQQEAIEKIANAEEVVEAPHIVKKIVEMEKIKIVEEFESFHTLE